MIMQEKSTEKNPKFTAYLDIVGNKQKRKLATQLANNKQFVQSFLGYIGDSPQQTYASLRMPCCFSWLITLFAAPLIFSNVIWPDMQTQLLQRPLAGRTIAAECLYFALILAGIFLLMELVRRFLVSPNHVFFLLVNSATPSIYKGSDAADNTTQEAGHFRLLFYENEIVLEKHLGPVYQEQLSACVDANTVLERFSYDHLMDCRNDQKGHLLEIGSYIVLPVRAPYFLFWNNDAVFQSQRAELEQFLQAKIGRTITIAAPHDAEQQPCRYHFSCSYSIAQLRQLSRLHMPEFRRKIRENPGFYKELGAVLCLLAVVWALLGSLLYLLAWALPWNMEPWERLWFGAAGSAVIVACAVCWRARLWKAMAAPLMSAALNLCGIADDTGIHYTLDFLDSGILLKDAGKKQARLFLPYSALLQPEGPAIKLEKHLQNMLLHTSNKFEILSWNDQQLEPQEQAELCAFILQHAQQQTQEKARGVE